MMLPLIVFMAALMLALVSAEAKSKKNAGDSGRDMRKADYLFLEGSRQSQLGNPDAYFEFLRRAHELNPEDKFVGKEYGFALMRVADDSLTMKEGYNLIEDYIKSNPGDFYGNVLFATLSSRLGNHDKAVDTWARLHEQEPGRPEIIIRYAEALTASGKDANIARALELYDTLESSEGVSPDLTSERIRLDLMRKDTTAVINDVTRLLESSPTVPEFNVFAGDIFSLIGKGDSAIKFYDKAVELDPSSGLAYYSRARYYQSIGDSVGFDREVFRALEQEDLDIGAKIEILRGYAAQFYSDSMQQPRINTMFQRLLDLHPHEADIHTLYRDYLVAIQDYKGAAEQASYALDIEPSDEKQWIALTTLYLQTEEMEKAYEASQRGLYFFPDNTLLHFFGGTVLSQQKKYPEAMKELEQALKTADEGDYETRSNIYTTIGDVFYNTHQTDSAFVNYSVAIELNPENMTALNNCAYYMACEDMDLDKALTMIEKVVDVRPDESTSLDTYAWVLFKRKEYDKAKDAIEKAIENDDNPSAELYEHAGDIYFMNREPAKALEMWKKALEIEPDNELLKKKVKYKTYFYE